MKKKQEPVFIKMNGKPFEVPLSEQEKSEIIKKRNSTFILNINYYTPHSGVGYCI